MTDSGTADEYLAIADSNLGQADRIEAQTFESEQRAMVKDAEASIKVVPSGGVPIEGKTDPETNVDDRIFPKMTRRQTWIRDIELHKVVPPTYLLMWFKKIEPTITLPALKKTATSRALYNTIYTKLSANEEVTSVLPKMYFISLLKDVKETLSIN